MVDNIKYYLGGTNIVSRENSTTIYNKERNVYDSNYYDSDNPASVENYLALMYTSDYGYAASDECMSNIMNYNSTSCKNNNWLFLGKNENLLMPAVNPGAITNINSDGSVMASNCIEDKYAVRPVLYLKPNAKISGTGITSDPYKFDI